MEIPKNDRVLIALLSFFVSFFLAAIITLSVLNMSGNLDFVVYMACSLFLLSAGLLIYTHFYGKHYVNDVLEHMVELFSAGVDHVEEVGMLTVTPLVTPYGRLDLKSTQWAGQMIQVRNSGVGVALNTMIIVTNGQQCLACRTPCVLSAGEKEKMALLPARVVPQPPEAVDGLTLFTQDLGEQARLLAFYQDALGIAYVSLYAIHEHVWTFLGTVRKTTLRADALAIL